VFPHPFKFTACIQSVACAFSVPLGFVYKECEKGVLLQQEVTEWEVSIFIWIFKMHNSLVAFNKTSLLKILISGLEWNCSLLRTRSLAYDINIYRYCRTNRGDRDSGPESTDRHLPIQKEPRNTINVERTTYCKRSETAVIKLFL